MPGLRSPRSDNTRAEDGRAISLSNFTKRRETRTSPANDFVSLLATGRFQGANSAGGSQIKHYLACYVWRWRCCTHPRTDGRGGEEIQQLCLIKVPAGTLQRGSSGARPTVSRVETDRLILIMPLSSGRNFYFISNLKTILFPAMHFYVYN